MKLKFDYKKLGDERRKLKVLRPIIPIELATKNKERVRYEALIDSGADMNMFHWEIAEVLGLKKKDALETSSFSGVSGDEIKAYYYDIFLILGGSDKKIVRCGFTNDIPDVGHGFLGQQGFFSEHRVEFCYDKERINIWV